MLSLFRRKTKVTPDPLHHGHNLAAIALGGFHSAIEMLEEANSHLHNAAEHSQAVIAEHQSRLNEAQAKITQNSSVAAKIKQLLS